MSQSADSGLAVAEREIEDYVRQLAAAFHRRVMETFSLPVLHSPASGAAEAPATAAPKAPSEQAVPDTRIFQYLSPDGNMETIGMWSPGARGDSTGVVKAVVAMTADLETSERWRAELAAGRLPHDSEDAP